MSNTAKDLTAGTFGGIAQVRNSPSKLYILLLLVDSVVFRCLLANRSTSSKLCVELYSILSIIFIVCFSAHANRPKRHLYGDGALCRGDFEK